MRTEIFLTSNIAARSIMLNVWGKDKIKQSEMISASIIAGGTAGCAGSLLRMAVHPTSLLPFLTVTQEDVEMLYQG
jgi:hypothetical protein